MDEFETPYRLTLLGRPALRDAAGAVVPLPLGKPFALLAVLALEPGPVERRALGRLLWSRSAEERARRSVRQALFVLRRDLGEALFDGADPVGLAAGALSTDVAEVEALLSSGNVEGALALWQGPLLEGFALKDAPLWEQLMEERRRELTERMARALEAEAGRCGDEPERALALRQAAVRMEPMKVERHVAVIESLLALHRFDAAASALAGSLAAFAGVDEAEAALRQVGDRLDRLRSGPGDYEEAGSDLPPAPFVGRTAEFAALLTRWREAAAGATRAVILTGTPGIGKTRLAAELAAHVGPDGRVVVAKALDVERELEWGLLADVVGRLLPLPGAAGVSNASDALLRSLLPSLAREVGERGADVGELRPAALADAVADLMAAVAYETPLLLIVDDLQWADPSSRSVLVRVARRSRRENCLFVFTCRSGRLDPALDRGLASLGEQAGALRLELTPLTRAETAELFVRLVDVPGDADLGGLVDRLYHATHGNPFYLVEAVRLLTEVGLLEQEPGGRPRLRPRDTGEGFALPASVEALMDRRIAALSEEAALAAGVLALNGPTTVRELARHAGLPATRALRAAEELVQRDVALWIDHNRLAFAHDELAAAAKRRFRHLGTPRHRWGGRAAAAAVVLVGLGLAARALATRRAPPPPYGGGVIVYRSRTQVLDVRPRSGPPSSWAVRAAAHSVPPGARVMGPFVDLRGDTSWYVGRIAPRTPPYVTRIVRGREEVVLKNGGDTDLRSVSPDGRHIVLTTEDLSTPQYDYILLLADADGTHPRQILKPGYPINGGVWSPDGRMIAANILSPTDTLVLLRPSGQRVRALPLPSLSWLAWCSDSVLVGWRNDRTDDALLRIDPRTGRVADLPSTGLVASRPACSPDGRALLYRTAVDGAVATVIQRIGATRPDGTLDLPRGDVWTKLRWVPPEPRAVANRVEIERDSVSMTWGARLKLQARVRYSDGSVRIAPLRWRSTDPDVASVLSDGTISANDPGLARIVASLGGWPADTAVVWVSGTSEPGTLFRDDFATLDSTHAWAVLGWPSPRTATVDGQPVLDLRGDGMNADGIMSRRAFRLPRGGTLELDFRMRFTRTDRQRFLLCLVQTDTVPTHTHDQGAWRQVQTGCFGLPWGELSTFRPTVAELHVTPGPSRLLPLPKLLPPHGWIHVALELRPDGTLTVFLNHRRIADAPIRMRTGPHVAWRIKVLDAAVDTHVLIRNLVLWPGLRYEAATVDGAIAAGRSPRHAP